MKIAIAGAGVAGSYLTYHLSRNHEVDVFEKGSPEELGKNCAWGTNALALERYCKSCNLNPENYLQHISGPLISDIYVNNDSVTFDKRQFLLDLLDHSKATVHFNHKVNRSDLRNYEVVVDATGPLRALLPPPTNDLSSQWILPTFQVEVRYSRKYPTDLPRECLFEPRGMGYLWAFPQGGKAVKVGCGSFDCTPKEAVQAYLSGKAYEERERTGGLVRMVPPAKSTPFFVQEPPPIIGVGESIGTVSPLSGEGITPTLVCSDLFLKAFRKNNEMMDVARHYRESVLQEFEWITKQFNFIRSLRFGNRFSQLWHLFNVSVPEYAAWDISKLGMMLAPFR